MSLKSIVAVLGGDLYDGGRRAVVPAPGHSPGDRSISLWLVDGRVVIHGFGSADWREARDDLVRRGLIGTDGRLGGGGACPPAPVDQVAAARRIWLAGSALRAGTPAARHLRLRHVRRDPARIGDLRYASATPVSAYRSGGPARPALLAAVRDRAGAISAVEITYLTIGGHRDPHLRLPRKTVGRLAGGGAVRLDRPGPVLLVAEGVFSALSAGERLGLPAWALLSAGSLARWSPPPGVEEVVVAADRDAAGEAAAARLAARLTSLGLAVSIRFPPEPFGDWNDAAAPEGEEGTGRGGPGRAGNGPHGGGPENDP